MTQFSEQETTMAKFSARTETYKATNVNRKELTLLKRIWKSSGAAETRFGDDRFGSSNRQVVYDCGDHKTSRDCNTRRRKALASRERPQLDTYIRHEVIR